MPAQYIQALLSGYSWGNYPISYSFPDSRNDYRYSYSYLNGFEAVETHIQQAVRFALEGTIGSNYPVRSYMALTSVDSFTNLNLYYTGRDEADIAVARSTWLDRSMGYYPAGNALGGDVWLSNYINSANVGTFGHMTILHELGHALGLKHGHEADNGNSVVLPADRDSKEFSVMTYRTHVGDDGSYFDATAPSTFMMYDIAALQYLYGANFNTNNTDTVYSWDRFGVVYVNGTAANYNTHTASIFMTIWDGGGVDTYDCSGAYNPIDVDLTPGGWSVLSPLQLADLSDGFKARGNVFNALQYQDDPRSLIENVIGGSMNDRIHGNAADNVLRGDAGDDELVGDSGNDFLYGGQGADHLRGGIGADVLDGGPGTYDTVEYSDAVGSVVIYLYNNTALGDIANGDVILNFENIIGGQGNDGLAGSDLANVIFGGRGNDRIYGYLGDDTLVGEDGSDSLYGHQGADTLRGGSGADVLDGGEGSDTVDYSDAVNSVTVYLYSNTAFGDVATGDVISNCENITGGQGNDILAGSDGANVIFGNDGIDEIYGWAGADYLDGGKGNDKLYAGSSRLGQADTLVGGEGVDTLYIWEARDVVIADFMIGPSGESIVFNSDILADYGAVLAASTQVGNDIVIDKPNLIHVVLKDAHMWSMVSSNFQFV